MPGRIGSAGSASARSGRDFAVVLICGCLISLMIFGLRSCFGLFTAPLSEAQGWSREVFAIAMGIQNLLWGLVQPVAGVLVDRYGPARMLACGGALCALGTALMGYATTPMELYLTAGVLIGLGLGGASYIMILAAFARLVPEAQRSWALGLGTAAGSVGQFLMVPLAQGLIAIYGWQATLLLLAALTGIIPLLAGVFRGGSRPAVTADQPERSLAETLRQALAHPSYRLLLAGFFVCGFQLSFVTIHMPSYLADAGISPLLAAWALGLVGLFNMIGAYLFGTLGGRYRKRDLLIVIYFGRAAATGLFLLLPITPASVLVFSMVLGLLWLSTAPLTSGLVAAMFGTRYVATLFGLVFLSHQIGSFLGIWIGGAVYARTGSYDLAWWTTVVLSLTAVLVHWPIAEARSARPATAV